MEIEERCLSGTALGFCFGLSLVVQVQESGSAGRKVMGETGNWVQCSESGKRW